MEHYKIVDGPSLRTLEIALFGDAHNQQQEIMFEIHDHDDQGNGICLEFPCIITSCGRTDPIGDLWNFIGKQWKITGTTFTAYEEVRGNYSTKTRKGWLEVGKPEEFSDNLRIETQDELAFHGDAHAKIWIYLGDILLSSVVAKVESEKGMDGGYYPVVKLTKIDHPQLTK